MIDHEQVLETLKNDLLAAGLDPAKYLAIKKDESPGHHLGRRCKECVHLYQAKDRQGKNKRWYGCKPNDRKSFFTGGEFACKEFEAKI